jgi:hypothetical protein
MRKFARSAALGIALALGAAPVMAANVSSIEGLASGTTATLDSNPVITAILSQPGTFNGRTYTNWSFLANDGTGSIDLFGAMPSGSTYTPTVGDAITASGTFSPFHQIPEFATLTAISPVSSGNTVPSPLSATIPQLNQATLPNTLAGYLVTLNNVTISSGTGSGASTLTPGETWATANLTLTVTDSSNNSMTLFYWPTSWSTTNVNLFGQTIPTGPVNMVGFASVFTSGTTSTPEFTPISITPSATPEPASLALFAIGAATLLPRRRNHLA